MVSTPDFLGPSTSHVLSRRSTVTLAFAERLSSAAGRARNYDGRRMAARLTECATNTIGWRCKGFCCPRCQARAAKRKRREVESILSSLPWDAKVFHVTLTTGADDIRSGRTVLIQSFAKLRRSSAWKAVEGGIGQVEIALASGTMRRWNVHLHCLALASKPLSRREVARAWTRVLRPFDVPCSAMVTRIDRRFVLDRDEGR